MPSPPPTSTSTSTPSPRTSAPNFLAPPHPSPPPLSQTPPAAARRAENVDPNAKPIFNPRLAFAAASGKDGRRPSVQFLPDATASRGRTDSLKPTGSPKAIPMRVQRRFSSPPPPSKYERRVSFNTFDNRDATDFSFTIAAKHKDYHYNQRSRTFLCGTDDNDYSWDAVEWLIEELAEDGDEIICLRVVDKDSKFASDASLRDGTYKKEAEQLLEKIKNKNKDKEDGEKEKAIGLTIELAVGKVPEVFQRMITVYAPACLIVGTKGKSPSGMQSFVTGSVSRYCLQNSPVPCIVVRPTRKRLAKKAKRRADDKRRNYASVVELSGARGSQMVLNPVEGLAELAAGGAGDAEAQAVAAAIGIPREVSKLGGLRRSLPGPEDEGAPLVRMPSARAESVGAESRSPSPTGPFVVSEGNSPEADALDSPAMSDEDAMGWEGGSNSGRGGGSLEDVPGKREDEVRGRTRSQRSTDEGGGGSDGKKTTGAKKFVFPKKERKKSEGSSGGGG
ncbi:MAG: hypothetical protein LQ348_001901 [Seirophora lacunosa]|nr:MAG: hypothetical protein LQ344_000871 [Seirophora lacunosa]KAI4199329.1 MAG: hypothetical protein LQ348_001901 [Seirophora lacunosa]